MKDKRTDSIEPNATEKTEAYPDDTIGSADFRDPSPNDIEECRGNYEAELMALPGSNRRTALDGYRNSNNE